MQTTQDRIKKCVNCKEDYEIEFMYRTTSGYICDDCLEELVVGHINKNYKKWRATYEEWLMNYLDVIDLESLTDEQFTTDELIAELECMTEKNLYDFIVDTFKRDGRWRIDEFNITRKEK